MLLLRKSKITKNEANDLLSTLLKQAKKYSFRFKREKLVAADVIKWLLIHLNTKENSNQTLEIMARFEVHLDRYIKKTNTKAIRLKALKIFIRAAQKSNAL